MGRLIDADALIQKLKRTSVFECVRNSEDKNVFEIINEQPTAYSIENVVAKLETRAEENRQSAFIMERHNCCDIADKLYAKQYENINAIDIVKRGGVDERT